MKSLNFSLAGVALVLVTACGGGGGDAGTSPFGGGGAAAGCSAASQASGASGCATAAALSLQLSAPTINNDGSERITATATATTATGQAIEGIPVAFVVDNNAVFTTSGTTTSASGTVTASVSPGADPSNRIVTVQARSGSLTAKSSFAVKGAKLAATASQAIVSPGDRGTVEFRLTNSNDVALPNQAVSVATSDGKTVTGATGVNGDYLFSFTAPTTLGAFDITASAGGVSKTQTVVVQTSASSIPAAVGPVLSASVAANPSVVPTNTVGSTVNRTEIRALFVGPGNAPVRNVRVRFDLKGDPSSVGGTFSTGNAVIYSDANGIATTAYIPADRASPTNGVTIRACYSTVDFSTGCPSEAIATVTVVADPLAVTIGTNSDITIGSNNLTFQRRFVVLVVDASGRAKGNVDIVPSIDLPIYFKGQYTRAAAWTKDYGTFQAPPPPPPPTPSPSSFMTNEGYLCPNEDVNRNGINEAGEDQNRNGSLEPRKSDVAISLIGGSKTKDDGTVVVQIEYPQNIASWLQVKLLVSATGVSGTEGRATWTEILPVPFEFLQRTPAPPFVFSPYGIAVTTQAVTYADGLMNPAAAPCQNPN